MEKQRCFLQHVVVNNYSTCSWWLSNSSKNYAQVKFGFIFYKVSGWNVKNTSTYVQTQPPPFIGSHQKVLKHVSKKNTTMKVVDCQACQTHYLIVNISGNDLPLVPNIFLGTGRWEHGTQHSAQEFQPFKEMLNLGDFGLWNENCCDMNHEIWEKNPIYFLSLNRSGILGVILLQSPPFGVTTRRFGRYNLLRWKTLKYWLVNDTIISIILHTWDPNDPCFNWKRPCFGGFNPQNRGHSQVPGSFIRRGLDITIPISMDFSGSCKGW